MGINYDLSINLSLLSSFPPALVSIDRHDRNFFPNVIHHSLINDFWRETFEIKYPRYLYNQNFISIYNIRVTWIIFPLSFVRMCNKILMAARMTAIFFSRWIQWSEEEMQTRGKYFRICKRDRARKNADTSPRDRQSSDFRPSAGILLPGYDSGTNLCPRLCPYQFNSGCVHRALLAESGKEATSASAKWNEIEFCIQSNKDSQGGKGGGRESVGWDCSPTEITFPRSFFSVFFSVKTS